jgi:hypothetical protein
MSATTRLKSLYAVRDVLALDAVKLHERLHRAGMHVTAHKMHAVVQSLGYELAEQLTVAQKQYKSGEPHA